MSYIWQNTWTWWGAPFGGGHGPGPLAPPKSGAGPCGWNQ